MRTVIVVDGIATTVEFNNGIAVFPIGNLVETEAPNGHYCLKGGTITSCICGTEAEHFDEQGLLCKPSLLAVIPPGERRDVEAALHPKGEPLDVVALFTSGEAPAHWERVTMTVDGSSALAAAAQQAAGATVGVHWIKIFNADGSGVAFSR
jgi:hypothetical protein